VYLRGWGRSIRVPIHFVFDGLFYLTQGKSTVDNGWWWFNPMIGAPFGLDELAFPANGNVDQALVWMVSRFVGNAIVAVNVTWLLMVVLSGLTATWCMRTIGASTRSAVVAGTLFALSPYALYRNIGHFGMAIYLVPFVCTVALQLITGKLPERGYFKGSGAVLMAGCALLAFNYVYYPFFGCFFIAVAMTVGFLAHRSGRILQAGSLSFAVLVGCTVLNLAPSLYSWSRNGKPIILVEKVPSQSELYGLKIRTLISPVLVHSFPPFRWWTEKERRAQFPLESENNNARLGLVGALGFIGLLGLLAVPAMADRLSGGTMLLGASRLTIAAVLLATIGGFGSLFSLLVSPQIRAYNRICPFIEFLALAAVALALDSLIRSRPWRLAAAVLLLVVGLGDQRGAAEDMNATYPATAAEMTVLEPFVQTLEHRLPDRAMVLQLPFRMWYNSEPTIERMPPYEQLKLYLVSHSLRWSYPAFSNEQVTWQQAAARLDPERLLPQAVHEGFTGLVVDRYGYADNGIAITAAATRAGLHEGDIIAQTDRYIGYDLRSIAAAGNAVASKLPTRLVPATSAMSVCGSRPLMSVEQIGSGTAFGANPPPVRGSSGFRVSGWAVDQAHVAPAAAVDMAIDQTVVPTLYGAERPDVADFFRIPVYLRSGFMADVPAGLVGRGSHTLSVRVVDSNEACYYESAAIALVVN
jgi:phosphoglycerol transferase